MARQIALRGTAFALLLCFAPNHTSAQTVITAAFEDFGGSNDDAFQVNFNAATSTSGPNTYLLLTPNKLTQKGSAFFKKKVSLGSDRAFNAYFTSRMYTTTDDGEGTGGGGGCANPADGFAFMLQSESNTAGSSGGGLGYQGITPSFVIEYDTFPNSGSPTFDPNANHIGISENGDTNSVATQASPGFDLNDGTVYHNWIDYNGSTETLEIRIATSNTRPGSPTLSRTMSLTSLVGQDAYAGFTAATGGCRQRHEIQSFFFSNQFITGGITPGTVTYQSAPTSVVALSSDSTIDADNTDTATITITVTNVDGSVAANQTVALTTTSGTLSASSGVTDALGQLSVTFKTLAGGQTATIRGQVTGGAFGEATVAAITPVPVVSQPSSGGAKRPTIRGTTVPSNTVEVYIDGVSIGVATADSSGNWSIVAPSDLTNGSHTVSAVGISSNSDRSTSSSNRSFFVTGGAVLDFDGDGFTDIGVSRESGASTIYDYIQSSDSVVTTATLPIGNPAPADYDGDGAWDPAIVRKANGEVELVYISSATDEQVTSSISDKTVTVLSGCHFTTSTSHDVVTLIGRSGKVINLEDDTTRNFSYRRVNNGDLLGCGDVDADGIDELLFRVAPKSGNKVTLAALSLQNKFVEKKRTNRFEGRFVLRRLGTDSPVVAALKARNKDGRLVRWLTTGAAVDLPSVRMTGSNDFSSGTFLVNTDQVAYGAFWVDATQKKVRRKLMNSSTSTVEDIDTTLTNDRVLKPQNIIRLGRANPNT